MKFTQEPYGIPRAENIVAMTPIPFHWHTGVGVIYDKTHTDLHGSLACAPFICTPAFFNRECRNDDSNYMVLGYIPNLGYGKGKAKRQTSTMRLQDEHDCLALITKQIIQIQTNGGFWTEVMGKKVCIKVWIHFITGDTPGHNNYQI